MDPPEPVRRPVRFGSKVSHRFGPLTGPLDVTGILCGFEMNPYWLVTVSGFQGSGAARGYVTCPDSRCQSLSSTDLDDFRELVSRDAKRPRLIGRGRRMGAGPVWLAPALLPDRPLNTPSYQIPLRLRTLGRSSFGNVPPDRRRCKRSRKRQPNECIPALVRSERDGIHPRDDRSTRAPVAQQSGREHEHVPRPISPRCARSAASPPGAHGPPRHSTAGRTSPPTDGSARRRSGQRHRRSDVEPPMP